MKRKNSLYLSAFVACSVANPAACAAAAAPSEQAAGSGRSTTPADAQVQANLKRFDQLDFDAYSHRKDMGLFRKLHCPDVKVIFPDGRVTQGIDAHVNDIDTVLFNGTPDSRITAHPIAFGSGDWTVATGVLEATFSEPMKMSDGTSVPPTGKAVKMSMVTLARWVDGCIAEEHLFWDNAEYMKQLGLAK